MPDQLNLVFRPVRPEDKPRVLEFTAHTWDDGDYISYVFDDWLADVGGQFTAVELDGQPVAISKLTDLGEGELWLEGLRVDPEQRRKGIGAALHAYEIELARKSGGIVVRYSTGQHNAVSRMFGARTGFREIGEYCWHSAEASPDFAAPTRLSGVDWLQLRPWLNSPLMQLMHGLYPRLWKWSRLSESRLQAHLKAGEVFGLRGELGWRAWSICALERDWDEAQVHHLDGIDRASLVAMAQALRCYAHDAGRKSVEVFAPDPSPLIEALGEAGYRAEDHRMILLELMLRDN